MVQRLDKEEQPPKSLNTVREMFFHTPIFFRDIKESKKLNKHLLKNVLAWKKRDEKAAECSGIEDLTRLRLSL